MATGTSLTRRRQRSGGEWYWSGDLGYFDGARYLFIVDRSKDMIISGGENVYSAEVADAVMAHPAVLECAVFGVPEVHRSERVHVAMVLHPGETLTIEHLQAFCTARIAGYKAPRSMETTCSRSPEPGRSSSAISVRRTGTGASGPSA